MPIKHTIQQGDSITSLAEQYGHFVDTIWNDPGNAELKALRKDMNILMAGDVVTIPDKRTKEVETATNKKHVFKRRGVPAKFRLQVFDLDEPRANQQYTLSVDGQIQRGTTDGDGVLEAFVPTSAREGLLIIGEDNFNMTIQFGHLNPIDTLSGVQQRLNNLGFDAGAEDGQPSPQFTRALTAFQGRAGLQVTGEADEQTKQKLVEIHDQVAPMPEAQSNTNS